MGVMRFVVPNVERITDLFLSEVFLAGIEGVPWRCHSERTEDGFQIRRQVDDSGCLHAMWDLSEGGQLLLSTANLMERERPYFLPLEIARGTLNRLRNQTAAWRQAGLVIPPEIMEQISKAIAPFRRAATNQHSPATAAKDCDESIRLSLQGCELLFDEYLCQLTEMRQQQSRPVFMFSGQLDDPAPLASAAGFSETFNMASIDMRWNRCESVTGDFDWQSVDETVDWARKQRLRLMAGPLLSFDSTWLPDWLVLWEDDQQALQSYVEAWVREAVERYRGAIHLWHCTAKVNSGRVLSLADDQRLQLTVAALETIRKHDPKTPVIISFDQPWAEYMTHTNTDVAPLHYADALARANLGLSGLGLHVDWGYRPKGTLPRNPLDVSHLLDQWSLLGLPLVVFMTMPDSLQTDTKASNTIGPLPGNGTASWDAQQQAKCARKLAQVCWCKQSVQGVVWNQTFDSTPHMFPNAGLYRADGQAKPLLASLQQMRSTLLDSRSE